LLPLSVIVGAMGQRSAIAVFLVLTIATAASGCGGSQGNDCGRRGCGVDAGGPASRSVVYARSSLGNLPALAATVNFHEITHLIVTFANPTETEPLALSSSDADVAVLVSAAHAAGAKVLVAIGGATHGPQVLPQLAPDKVDAFVQTIVAFVDARDFDGVDIDIEGVAFPAAGYEALAKGLSAALEPRGKLLTAAVAPSFDPLITPAAFASMDFVSVMAYDGCAVYGPEPCQHSSYEHAVEMLDHFVEGRKLPADRVVLGVPFYGYCWGAGCGAQGLTYAEIVARFPEAADGDFVDRPDAKAYYNGPATIERKTKLGRQYGGVMAWHLAGDAPPPHSLLDVIASALAP
jgi:chitinase